MPFSFITELLLTPFLFFSLSDPASIHWPPSAYQPFEITQGPFFNTQHAAGGRGMAMGEKGVNNKCRYDGFCYDCQAGALAIKSMYPSDKSCEGTCLGPFTMLPGRMLCKIQANFSSVVTIKCLWFCGSFSSCCAKLLHRMWHDDQFKQRPITQTLKKRSLLPPRKDDTPKLIYFVSSGQPHHFFWSATQDDKQQRPLTGAYFLGMLCTVCVFTSEAIWRDWGAKYAKIGKWNLQSTTLLRAIALRSV